MPRRPKTSRTRQRRGSALASANCSTFLTDDECDSLHDLFNAGAARINDEPEHWIGGADEGLSYCYKCAKKEVAKLLKKEPDAEYCVDGGWGSDSDGTPFCEICQKLLRASLTQYGCSSEVAHFTENGFNAQSDMDCYCMERVISSSGWRPYTFDGEETYRTKEKEKYFKDLHALGRRILDALSKSNSEVSQGAGRKE